MQQQTAADIAVDAAASVATVLDPSERRVEAAEAFVVGTILVLAAGRAPILGVPLVGYVVASARDHATPVSEFDDWRRFVVDGFRATALLVVVSLPAALVLLGAVFTGIGGSDLVGVGEGGLIGIDGSGGPLGGQDWDLGPEAVAALVVLGALVALSVAAWHCVVAGLVALAWAEGRPESTLSAGVRIARSAPTRRLSFALVGVGLASAVVRFGFGGVPLFGPVLAAGATFFGVAVAARLLGRAVVAETRRADRLATSVGNGKWADAGGGEENGTGGRFSGGATRRPLRRGRP